MVHHARASLSHGVEAKKKHGAQKQENAERPPLSIMLVIRYTVADDESHRLIVHTHDMRLQLHRSVRNVTARRHSPLSSSVNTSAQCFSMQLCRRQSRLSIC
ncbi:hypothetical protein RvY_02336 [Ramazzottius varieornatus]|uniref:Uncharacterized protein n=1 Tax=Ramazzottius varieornatus TaxID=947166 RepID=A0A1D1UQ95_RAMVA|nr:hypothetical protein RvY_02336 [Ramazzottius varieornatus]